MHLDRPVGHAHQRLVAPGLQGREVPPLGRRPRARRRAGRRRPGAPGSPARARAWPASPCRRRSGARRPRRSRRSGRPKACGARRCSAPTGRGSARRGPEHIPPRRLRAQLIQRKTSASPPPSSPITALGGRRTSGTRARPVWPSAMIVCCTGPRARAGGVHGHQEGRQLAALGALDAGDTWACSTNGAPVIRCLTPLSTHPSPSRRAEVSSARASEPAPGSVSAKATLVRPARKSARWRSRASGAPVAHQVARAVGPGEHPLHAAQAVAVDLLLDVEGVDQAEAQAAVGRRAGAGSRARPRPRPLHPALEPDQVAGQAAVRLQREGGAGRLPSTSSTIGSASSAMNPARRSRARGPSADGGYPGEKRSSGSELTPRSWHGPRVAAPPAPG